MKVSDYIVEFLIEKGVTDVFGYPGGMVTHLMDSFSKMQAKIRVHVNYHEQAAAFAACGYAQETGITGVAYATSGPGATNLITGIANAWFDSIPVIFITGQVNTFEDKGNLGVRQQGFQETDIISMVKKITKYCVYVSKVQNIRYELEKSWYYANEGRKGPVLLDIPMNIQRGEIKPEELQRFGEESSSNLDLSEQNMALVRTMLQKAKRPLLLIGAGVKTAQAEKLVHDFLENWNIPVVSSMLAVDVMGRQYPNYFGFIGAYGDRVANFIAAKSDLILSIGSRLDIRQVGAVPKNFGGNAKLIRVDIDAGEFTRKIKDNEMEVLCDLKLFLKELIENESIPFLSSVDIWLSECQYIKKKLAGQDKRKPNEWIQTFSEQLPADVRITTDVGQNQVWIAQSFRSKDGQRVFFSGGHGAMGYSLPAAIGVYYGSKIPVISFNGDGGIQMNIQELQFVARENLPVTIVILNNSSLGMIRHFQEMYFHSNYCQTIEGHGYSVPNFKKIAGAYGIDYHPVNTIEDITGGKWDFNRPQIIEFFLENHTYVFPKLEYGRPNQDQEPLLDRDLYQHLMALDMINESKG